MSKKQSQPNGSATVAHRANPHLLLMRHAKAAYPDGVSDHERPLAPRGRKDAPKVGHWLVDQGLTPQLVVCSDAARTVETADLVVAGTTTAIDIVSHPDLYESHVGEVLQVVSEVPEEIKRVLVVGHEPTISATVAALTGQWVSCPTAALAVIELTVPWSRVAPDTGSLSALRTP